MDRRGARQTLCCSAYFVAYEAFFIATKCVDASDRSSYVSICLGYGRPNSDRARRVGIRRFFVKRRLEDGAMRVERRPTKETLADKLAKPLVGEQLRILRDASLGYK